MAALLHFLLLAFWPEMKAQDVSTDSRRIEAIDIPREFGIPPPPEQIQQPAVPVLSTDVSLSEDITVPETIFREHPASELPPPPSGGGVDVSDRPVFTPYDVKPEIRNRKDLQRLLERNYPPMLGDAGIGGTTVLHVFIDETGSVENTQIRTSSGYEALDEAARAVTEQIQFTPALNRDQRVPVWVQIPVTWQVR